jgi:chorismate mutase/prephenate dehydratase
MGSSLNLEDLRKRIDEIDKKILEFLNERAKTAIQISKLKQENSFNVYDPAREREIERKIKKANLGPLSQTSVISIFKEIISACRSIQTPIKVAYLGPDGTFSHQAAFHEFGGSAKFKPCRSIEEVFEEVEKERVSFGIVPVENSLEGSVSVVLDRFLRSDLQISSELFEKISHFLISKTGDIKDIKIVASHPQALGQCRKWLSEHLKRVEYLETPSTASASKLASRDKKIAAVASEFSASIYKLKIVERQIEDGPGNTTRFWVIGKEYTRPTGADKTSIVFSLKDEPGTLYKALAPFSQAGINLTKIESRPSKERPWEYVFFVDFEGHAYSEKTGVLLSKVKESCVFLKVLGSYPASYDVGKELK